MVIDIDSTVIAAVIAGSVALVTVVMTVFGAVLTMIVQLTHDRSERAKDRALQTKRELLIEGVK